MDGQPTAREGRAVGGNKPARVLDVTVLMGGPSSEREISLISGSGIADALERLKYRVTRADISPSDTSALDRKCIDVVFIALHGDFGESGEVQAMCESRALRYTGSSPHASQLAMDKAASKQMFKRAGLNTPEWMIIEEFHSPARFKKWLPELSLPVVVKPVDGGSSIDITIARDTDQRDEALDTLIDKYGRAMLEQYVPGRELTVGVLGAEALPVIEIVPSRDFYDYVAKYADDSGTRFVFDHGLSDQQVKEIQAAAMQAHQCLGCRDMSRVDFVMDASGAFQVLEINTIPGFTSHSLLPMAAAKAGISFDQLVERLVRMALQRQA